MQRGGEGEYTITVREIAVFVHDKFQFEEDDSYFGNDLAFWSCEKLAMEPIMPPLVGGESYQKLKNSFFREFRNNLGNGGDFLVLSMLHKVETFTGVSYVYPCK